MASAFDKKAEMCQLKGKESGLVHGCFLVMMFHCLYQIFHLQISAFHVSNWGVSFANMGVSCFQLDISPRWKCLTQNKHLHKNHESNIFFSVMP